MLVEDDGNGEEDNITVVTSNITSSNKKQSVGYVAATDHLAYNRHMTNQHTHQGANSTVTEHTANNLHILPYM